MSTVDRKTVRSLNGMCRYCRSVTSTAKQCSRCRSVFYCNATCQKSDWKGHKIFCVDYKETRDKDALVSGGMDFVKYVDSWRAGSASLFNLLIKAAIPLSQKDSHAIILFSDYREDRAGHFEYKGSTFLNPLVQIQRYEVLSLDEIRSTLGGLGQWVYESIMSNRLAGNVGPPGSFLMIHMVKNLDSTDLDSIPLLRMSNLGTDVPAKDLRSVQEYISDCNRGIIDFTRLLNTNRS